MRKFSDIGVGKPAKTVLIRNVKVARFFVVKSCLFGIRSLTISAFTRS